jgi:hypothetical protein
LARKKWCQEKKMVTFNSCGRGGGGAVRYGRRKQASVIEERKY